MSPTPVPVGTRLIAARTLRVIGTILLGGTPPRLVRLTARGEAVAARLLAGAPVTDVHSARLARRLLAAGLVHPVPDGIVDIEVTALVPVRDRAAAVRSCLGELDIAAVVVDDGSADPEALADVCTDAGATLVRRDSNGGPAAARNTGLTEIGTELVAFVDSDVVLSAGSLRQLVAHFADPAVVAAAPRIRPRSTRVTTRVLTRFLESRSPLDLGPTPALVRPGGAVSYVPTACLVVRRDAIRAAGCFDEQLRFGEDVDLVWRLVAAGGDVRYEPGATAWHTEPQRWREALGRRYRYGTSAGPLARRHTALLAPYRSGPLPAIAAASLAFGPAPAGAIATAATAGVTVARLRRLGVPRRHAVSQAGQAVFHSCAGLGRYVAGVGLPLAVLALAAPGRRRRRAARLVFLAAVPALHEYAIRKPRLDPVRWVACALADDVAYAAGVWRGSMAAHTAGPLVPNVR